ncbi:MAG: hypothetical protein UV00_C0028G0003 [candidate division WWE3 bacterium GW2011_GWF1_42_14]|uniref:HNH nuclease domain-containing protein n=1 Tax=candidate division WWE3 bacterium GW2011_GWF1_42_14 TaxID=1619138 RepID=A0A0G0YI62_UNCKA|nr:MAG: hypothetical protein UV00_C0028G0003 [candidate division WWE3 bacterium GW2011_GWF1_42_14]
MGKTKTCFQCKRDLPADRLHFYIASHTKDKFHSACKECEGHKFSKPKLVEKEGHKICTKCNRELLATLLYFEKSSDCRYGVSSICKECRGRTFMIRELIPVIDGYKVCNICRVNLPNTKEYFYSSGSALRPDCKECESKKIKAYYVENVEHKRCYARDWYQGHCSNNEEYRINNSVRAKKHRIANQYTDRYKTSQNIKSQRRRSLKNKLISTLTAKEWTAIKQDFNNTCAYCGEREVLTQDHFIPLKVGGEYAITNIIPACKSCNSQKSAKLFSSWYPTFKHYTHEREAKILSYLGYVNGHQQLSLL